MTVIDSFVEWANAGLLQSDEAIDYVRGRGVSEDQIARHRIGYAIGDYHPDTKFDLGHDENVCKDKSKDHLWCDTCRFIRWSSEWKENEEGLRTRIVGRRIAGCVVFPLTSYSGSLVGVQMRSIREKQFDSFTLNRRPEGYFFGIGSNLDTIWKTRRASVVEGPFDHLVWERLIGPNVIGLTTNAPGLHHIRFFRRFVDVIDLCLDNDKAGREGVQSFVEKLGSSHVLNDVRFDVKNRKGEKCKDVNEAWTTLGDQKFVRYFSERMR